MSWRPLEGLSIADAGFEAGGDDLPGLLASAVDATLSVMVGDPSRIEPRERRRVRLEGRDAGALLRALLEEIVYRKDAERLFFRLAGCSVAGPGGRLVLEADLAGEPLDPNRHAPGTDVKAVTLQGFSVTYSDGCWQARFVLDV